MLVWFYFEGFEFMTEYQLEIISFFNGTCGQTETHKINRVSNIY